MTDTPDFIVLGKVTQPPEMGGGVQYVCRIHDTKWWVPDDMDNADRQKVEVWIDDGKAVPDLSPEEASAL